jgi:DNA repair exonuclease SbcCD ATPase subunit
MVIRTKLPLINEQIHNILQDIVSFKVDLEIDDKGNVEEVFYFMENKADALSLGAMASASQKFIVTLAIKNAFYKVSNYAVSQPSIIMIDEGFGSLDNNHIAEVQGMLFYLATKYKNVLIITHLNEVKDSVNNIIEVSKDRSFMGNEELSSSVNAGASQFNFSLSSSNFK